MGNIAIIKRQQLEQLVVVSTGGEREREMKREEHIRKYLKSRVSPFFSISFSPFVLISFFFIPSSSREEEEEEEEIERADKTVTRP